MKCTNFYEKLREIKRHTNNELRDAVAAHDGRFEFDRDEDRPIVSVDKDGGPCNLEVTMVCADEGWILIHGIHAEHGYDINVDSYDVYPGHLAYITEAIPETDKVKDVTIN